MINPVNLKQIPDIRNRLIDIRNKQPLDGEANQIITNAINISVDFLINIICPCIISIAYDARRITDNTPNL